MSATRVRTPSYRLHRPSGQAVVTLSGKDVYLGPHGSPESRSEYDRAIAEWLTGGRRPPALPRDTGTAPVGLALAEIILAYLRHADVYYSKNGEPTSEPRNIRLALRPLRHLYGTTSIGGFGPLALKSVRETMIQSGICRNEVNKRVRHIVRMFRWAVENELVPPAVFQGLKAVKGLAKGRTKARESSPVKPVPDASVDAIRPHVSRQIWAMIELQRLSGMRPGEVCMMRACDLDVTGTVWVYTPDSHKTEHRGRERLICLGPRAQEIVRPWLRVEMTAFLFSPAEAMAERRAIKRQGRKSKVQPSQLDRRKPAPSREPGDHYDVPAYNRAIDYGCRKAGLPKWHPHQLRHNAATQIRARFGLEAVQTVLGHAKADVTQIYAERDMVKARDVMAAIG